MTGSSIFLRSSSSAEDVTQTFDSMEIVAENSTEDGRDSEEKENTSKPGSPKPSRIQRFGDKLINLEIPRNNELFDGFGSQNPDLDSPTGGYEAAEDDAFASGRDGNRGESILEEPVLQMNSKDQHQDSKTLQAEKLLSGKWTTGAGPRIKYVRDYPPNLQVRALEQVNLSPRSSGLPRSPRSSTRHSPMTLSSTEPVTEPPPEGSIASRLKSSLSRRVSY